MDNFPNTGEGILNTNTVSNDDSYDEEEVTVPIDFYSWGKDQQDAWSKKDENPNVWYYRYKDPGEEYRFGTWSDEEKGLFIQRIRDVPRVNEKWGLFSQVVPDD